LKRGKGAGKLLALSKISSQRIVNGR
jgi:hypothetical protein